LPFETLVTEVSKDFKEAYYLIEDVPIAYLSKEIAKHLDKWQMSSA